MVSERPVVRRAAGIFALAALLVAALYGRSLDAPFTRDDALHLAPGERFERPPARWGEHFGEDFWAQGSRSGLYRPLTALTIQATVAAAGREPRWLRAGNLLLLALLAAAAGALALRFGLPPGAGALLAALVAVHPLWSEPALEIVSRGETQAALFVLLSALLVERGGGGGFALATLACGGAALLSKEGAFAALPAIALVGGAPRAVGAPRRRVALPLLGLAVATLGALALRIEVFGDVAGFAPEETAYVDNPLIEAPFAVRLFTGLAVLGRYVLLLVWPARLSVDWSYAAIVPLESPADPWCAAGAAALVGGLVWLAAAWRGGAARRAERFGLLLAGGSWLLVSNVVRPIGTVMGERLFALPALGLLIAAVGAAARAGAGATASLTARRALAAAGVAAAAALGARTFVRAGDWRDGLALYEAAAQVAPDSARVRATLAHILLARGRADEALDQAQRAVAILPEYGKAHGELAAAHASRGAFGAALVHLWLAAAAPGASPSDQLRLRLAQERTLAQPRARADFVRHAALLCERWSGRPLFEALRTETARVAKLP